MDHFNYLVTNLRLQLQIVFPKLCFVFSILISILFRNMCKSRLKLRNTKIYPLEVQILQCHFLNNKGSFFSHISDPTLSKQFFSKVDFFVSVLGSMVSNNMCKLRHKLKKAKNLPELTW